MPRTSKPTKDLTETDFASDKMGKNSLQGDDQSLIRNERQAVPGVNPNADESIMESLEKSDKNVRARSDLGKGKGIHRRSGR